MFLITNRIVDEDEEGPDVLGGKPNPLGPNELRLDSRRAVHVNFTAAQGVGDSHAYFEGKPAEKNPEVFKFFGLALNGGIEEEDLAYDVARNMYVVR